MKLLRLLGNNNPAEGKRLGGRSCTVHIDPQNGLIRYGPKDGANSSCKTMSL